MLVSGVDEDAAAVGLDPSDGVGIAGALAAAKAEAVATALMRDEVTALESSTIVIGCDSVLVHGGAVHGKPGAADVAHARWRAMAGTCGALVTGHSVLRVDGDHISATAAATASTIVRFGAVTDDDIGAYVATGEPLAVAGGFTLDGIGGLLIDGIDGCPSNVIGLSLPVLRRLLVEVGSSWTAHQS